MAFSPYLSIAHHVPGRIRLRFRVTALASLSAARLNAFANSARGADGVRSFRVNAVARSLAIEYDPALLPPALWTQFLEGDDEEAARIAAHLAPHFAGGTSTSGEQAPSEEDHHERP
jgi:hypothetical protein